MKNRNLRFVFKCLAIVAAAMYLVYGYRQVEMEEMARISRVEQEMVIAQERSGQ